jgi:hypothetical protein
MERATIGHCCGCQQPIIRGEDFVAAVLGMNDKTTTSLGVEGDGNGRRQLSSGF